MDGLRIQVPSNWNFKYLEKKLKHYHNKEIINMLKYGFPIECDTTCSTMQINDNHKGATSFPDDMDAYISKELEKGTLIGPFQNNPFGNNVRFSPLNTRSKRDSQERRVIMDLSYLEGSAVNTGVSKTKYRGKEVQLVLPTVDSLIQLVKNKKGKILLFKRDLKAAYKQVPVCLGEINVLGYIYKGLYYFDVSLPMGLTNSAYICELVTDMIMYVYGMEGYQGLNYLDDLAGCKTEQLAEQAFVILGDILKEMGVKESEDKACPPNVRMIFLGLIIDTILMRIEISSERMSEIRTELSKWLHKSEANLREIQQLVGKLSFCATAVRAGRLFFSRILNFLRQFHNSETLSISVQVKQDIRWWIHLMPQFNGISKIPGKWQGPNKWFSVDACKDHVGGWAAGQYFHAHFPDFILSSDNVGINELELVGIMIAIKMWGYLVANQNFLVQCDNQIAVRVLNTGAARNIFTQAVLREICYITALNDSLVRGVYLPANQNRIADSLSRWHKGVKFQNKFRKLTTGLKTTRIQVPEHMFRFSNDW